MNQFMIQLENIRKNYGEQQALRGISFQVPKGQVVGFLGPNGAGKTTTMKILTGFLEPSSGTARVAGLDLAKDATRAQRLIGYLPENNPLYEEMMVYDYLHFVGEVRKVPRGNLEGMIRHAAARCGVTRVLGQDIGTLSKGYRQRVGLAQAILHDPELLILDEPTSGLDPNQIIEIRDLIKDLGKDKTVLMSTHILSEAESTCSRILIIRDGELVADDTPQELTRTAQGLLEITVSTGGGVSPSKDDVIGAFSQIFGVRLHSDSFSDADSELSFRLSYEQDPRAQIFQTVVKRSWVLLEMRRKDVTLEETFRRLTVN